MLYITVNYTPMLRNVLSYWEHRTDGVLFIKYEDMKSDISKVITQIAKYLNRPMSEEQLKMLQHHVSFEVMKDNTSTHHAPVLDYLRKCGAVVDNGGCFMRSGKSGGYKSLMNDEVEEIFDKWMEQQLQNTGLVL